MILRLGAYRYRLPSDEKSGAAQMRVWALLGHSRPERTPRAAALLQGGSGVDLAEALFVLGDGFGQRDR
jgi:hypothetical protein